MVLTRSSEVPLGTEAIRFSLLEPLTGNTHSLPGEEESKGTLVMFICNHCPYVVHILEQLAALGRDYSSRGMQIFAINSNDYVSYPDDSPEKMVKYALENGFNFPYLLDETQEVARQYGATCTPDFFLYDRALKLVYRGQLDASRPGSHEAVTGKDLRAAMDALLEDRTVNQEQKPSMGCNIKWKR